MSENGSHSELPTPSVHYTTHLHFGPAKGSHHNIGGNQYQDNVTRDSSAASFGQIDQRSTLDPALDTGVPRVTETASITVEAGEPWTGGFMQNRRMTAGRRDAKQPEPPGEVRASSFLPTLSIPEGSGKNQPVRSPSANTPVSERFASPEETQITLEELPEFEFERRQTGSWFGHGKMFEISGQHRDDRTIASRCYVVVARSSDIVCLPLCRYRNVSDRDTAFLKRRLRLQRKGASTPEQLLGAPVVEMAAGRPIHDDIFINCEKPYTIHHRQVDVAYLGDLTEDAVHTLTKVWLQTLEGMSKSPEPRTFLCVIWDLIAGAVNFVIRRRPRRKANYTAV